MNGILICSGAPKRSYGRTGLPQPLFFFVHQNVFVPNMSALGKHMYFIDMHCLCVFFETPNRHVTQRHAKWQLIFVLSSDTKTMSNICQCNVLIVFGMFGTRYQVLGTKYIHM